MSEQPGRLKDLFLAARDRPDAAERAEYVDRECAGDPALRDHVLALLAAHDRPASALEAPFVVGETREFAEPDPERANTATFDPGPDDPTGTVIAGRYRLTERIGTGGMGEVWLAHQSEPVKRKVAVKLIKAGMDSKAVLARFEAERQALAVMDHPNIAKVLDGGLHEGRPYFVMELVKGTPVTEYCDARKLTPKQRLELFVPVCQAIQHAHQKGIIHRDIKPSNVLIALYDDKPVPKVIDFGIAKATGGTLTEQTIETAFGGIVGTPQYMSPEQASLNNLDIDTRSDVYSLGVLLYELLTGSPPFARKELEKKGLLEILRVVREEEPPRPSTKLSTADALPSLSANRGTEPKKLTGLLRNELDWIVMKALEKDRTRRYETANGFAADVNRYLNGDSVQAHPPSVGYRLRKFIRRNQLQVTAAGLVFGALLAGVIGTSWQTLRANRARVAEAEQRAVAEENEKKAVEAGTAEKVASQQARDADAASRRGLARQYVDRGGKLLDEGNYNDALTWFTAAWEKEADVIDSDREAVHRLRVSTTAQMAPKPVHVWQHTEDERVDIQITPDGRKVITHTALYGAGFGRKEGTVRVWDLESGRPLTPPLPNRLAYLSTHRFDANPPGIPMSRDGRRLVTETRADLPVVTKFDEYKGWSARVWDADTGEAVSPPLPCGGTGWTSLSPDGHHVLTVVPAYSLKDNNLNVTGGEARIWDARTGAPVTPPLVMPGGVGMASFTADGTRVITGHPYPGTCMVWDAQSGQALTPLLRAGVANRHRPADGNVLRKGHWTADQTRLVAVEANSPENTPPRIWDVNSGRPLTPPLPLEGFVGTGFEISPGGKRILFTIAESKTLFRLSELLTGKTVATLKAQLSDRPLFAAGFTPDGKWVYGTSAILGRPDVDKNVEFDTVWVWDALTGNPKSSTLRFDGTLDAIDLSDDGQRILLRGKNATKADLPGGVQVWKFPSGTPATPVIRHQDRPTKGTFGPDGRDLLTFGGTHARVWDIATGVPRTPVLPHAKEVTDAKFTPDGRFVVTACAGGRVLVWPTRAGEPAAKQLTPGEPVYRLNVDATGTRMLTDTGKKTLRPSGITTTGMVVKTNMFQQTRLWDMATGRSVMIGRSDDVLNLHTYFSPNGAWVVSHFVDEVRIGSKKNGLKIWNARTLAPVKTILIADPIAQSSFLNESVFVYTVRTDIRLKSQVDGTAETPATAVKEGNESAAANVKATFEFRAIRLPGGEPVTPAPTSHIRKPIPNIQVIGGTAIRFPGPTPNADLSISPHGGADAGWASSDKRLLWSAGRRTPLASYFTLFPNNGSYAWITPELNRFEIRGWDAQSGEPIMPQFFAQGVSLGGVNYSHTLQAQTFTGTDRDGIVYPAADGVRLWDFPKDSRPSTDWVRTAEALAGNRFNAGSLVALSDNEWGVARKNSPDSIGRPLKPAEWASEAAAEAEKANDRRAAQFHLNRLIAIEPNDGRHYQRLGNVLTGGKSEDWVRINGKAIELGATAWQAWYNRGLGLANLGRWAEAEADFLNATTRLDETNGSPWFHLLHARLAQGDVAGYRKAFAEALTIAGPDLKGLEFFNAVSLAVLVPDVVADPKQLDLWVAKLAPGRDPKKHELYGEACFRTGRYAEALDTLLGKGLPKPPDPGPRLPYLAMTYFKLGGADKARETLARAAEWHDRHVVKKTANPATGQVLALTKRVEFAALLREAKAMIGDVPTRTREVAPTPAEKK